MYNAGQIRVELELTAKGRGVAQRYIAYAIGDVLNSAHCVKEG